MENFKSTTVLKSGNTVIMSWDLDHKFGGISFNNEAERSNMMNGYKIFKKGVNGDILNENLNSSHEFLKKYLKEKSDPFCRIIETTILFASEKSPSNLGQGNFGFSRNAGFILTIDSEDIIELAEWINKVKDGVTSFPVVTLEEYLEQMIKECDESESYAVIK